MTEKLNYDEKFYQTLKDALNDNQNDYSFMNKYFNEIEGFSGLISQINETSLGSVNSIIISLKKILWKETELNDLLWKDKTSILSLLLWQKGIFQKTEFNVMINYCLTQNILDIDDIPHLYFLIEKNSLNNGNISFDKWANDFLEFTHDLTSETPPLKKLIEIYKIYIKKPLTKHWQRCLDCVTTIIEHPEYIEDILEETSEEELKSTLPWLDLASQHIITQYLVNNYIKSLPNQLTQKELANWGNNDNLIENIPPTVNVLGEYVTKLPSQPVNPDIFTSIPEKLVKNFVPKFVYSASLPERDPNIRIFFPGGEGIGHSAIIIKSNQGVLLFDFGMSVVNNTIPKWYPILDYVDAVFLSHAHLDHSGAIPLLFSHHKNLPVFSTIATKEFCSMLWHDSTRLIRDQFNLEKIKKTNKHNILHEIIDYTNIDNALDNFYNISPKDDPINVLPQVDVSCYEASHLFGSLGFEIDIQGKRIFYTGDFNKDGTAIFPAVKFPTDDANVVIFDGTYYGRDRDLTTSPSNILSNILKKHKRVLIPAFSMGRSQEMLYNLLDVPDFKQWKIYVTGMGSRVAKILKVDYENIILTSNIKEEKFSEKSIVIAGQGMLQGGLSRNLLEYTSNDPETAVVICGYQAPGTMGYNLLQNHPYLKQKYIQDIVKIPVSGHTNGPELTSFIDSLSGKKIMVHAPEEAYASQNRDDIFTPRSKNLDSVL